MVLRVGRPRQGKLLLQIRTSCTVQIRTSHGSTRVSRHLQPHSTPLASQSARHTAHSRRSHRTTSHTHTHLSATPRIAAPMRMCVCAYVRVCVCAYVRMCACCCESRTLGRRACPCRHQPTCERTREREASLKRQQPSQWCGGDRSRLGAGTLT
eukprot:1182279-Prorocentrum_minimum.AAC.5